MSRYELLLFLHIVCVIVWLGLGSALGVIALLAERGETTLVQVIGPLGRVLGPRVFGPASLGALVFGILLVLDGSWTFEPLWIRLGLAAFLFSFVLNVAVRAPLVRRQQRGSLDAGIAARRLGGLARVELTVLYLTVGDMVAKPSGADVATLLAGGAILGLSIAFTAVRWRGPGALASGRVTGS